MDTPTCLRRWCQDYFPLFPLVNSSFGNNENLAIARKCAWAVRSRYNRVSLYTLLQVLQSTAPQLLSLSVYIYLVPKGVQEKRTEVLENRADRMRVSNAVFE